ncbi:hypothetical protein B0G71_8053 [Paraburkholderia sp. BL27I4N3]|nr:hypothetical protein B0G71_8053 [Paraburkholderia sp. BL27I4N3]
MNLKGRSHRFVSLSVWLFTNLPIINTADDYATLMP